MKKLIILLGVLFFIGCNDNAFDGENGLIGTATTDNAAYFENVRTSVLANNAQKSINNTQELITLSQAFRSDITETNQKRLMLNLELL